MYYLELLASIYVLNNLSYLLPLTLSLGHLKKKNKKDV